MCVRVSACGIFVAVRERGGGRGGGEPSKDRAREGGRGIGLRPCSAGRWWRRGRGGGVGGWGWGSGGGLLPFAGESCFADTVRSNELLPARARLTIFYLAYGDGDAGKLGCVHV